MKRISPSWIDWDVGENNFPDQVKPPNVNKKQGRDAEEADVKSASETQVITPDVASKRAKAVRMQQKKIRLNQGHNYTQQPILLHPTPISNVTYERPSNVDLRVQKNKDRIDELLKTIEVRNKTNNIQFKKVDANNIARNKNKILKRISAKPTKAYKKFTKSQIEDHRETAKNYKDHHNWKLNPNPVKSEFSLANLRNRKLGSTLALLFSKIAEERMGEKIIGSDKWDIEQIMFRRISKKLITNCRYKRERQKVIIMLDSSPSCSRMANLYSQISTEACKYEDVELYDAPNGYAHSKYCSSERKFVSLSDDEIDLTYLWSGFEDRTIIYFGDTDALRSIKSAYKTNEVHWFFQAQRNYGDLKQQTDRIRREYGDMVNVYSANDVDEIVRAVRDIR